MSLISIYRSLFGYDHLQDGTVIDLAEHGRTGGTSDGQGFKFSKEAPELTKVDEASATVTYMGVASFGTATSAPDWQIKRITVSGTVTTIEYAYLGNYTAVWDDRASLSYT